MTSEALANKISKENILILGAKGLLGQALVKELAEERAVNDLFSLTAWDKEDLDLTNLIEGKAEDGVEGVKRARQKILDLRPTMIINATGYTAVDKAESEPEVADLINGKVVGELARLARELGAVMVHFSTDYIFDGLRDGGYNEDEKASPLNAYARSKVLGEKLLEASGAKYYLARSSWLFGPGGANFVDSMLKLAREKGELKIVNDQIGKPTYTVDLAEAVVSLFRQRPAFGIYHLVNECPVTKYELIREAVKLTGLNVKIKPCATEEFPSPARRPMKAYLNNNKWEKLRPWKEAMVEYLKDYNF